MKPKVQRRLLNNSSDNVLHYNDILVVFQVPAMLLCALQNLLNLLGNDTFVSNNCSHTLQNVVVLCDLFIKDRRQEGKYRTYTNDAINLDSYAAVSVLSSGGLRVNKIVLLALALFMVYVLLFLQ